MDSVANRWIVAIALFTTLLILGVLAILVYFRMRKHNSGGVTIVKPKYTTGRRSGGDTSRAPTYKREKSQGDDWRRGTVSRRQPTAAPPAAPAAAKPKKPDTSKLQQKSVAPVIAAAPLQSVGKPHNQDKKNLHAEDEKPDVTKQQQQREKEKDNVTNINQVLVKEKTPPLGEDKSAAAGGGGGASDLDDFNGMAKDPASGRFYAYNKQTGKRRWLRSKEVKDMEAKLNK